jgi:PXA domain
MLHATISSHVVPCVDKMILAFRIAYQPLQPYPLANSPRRIYHTLHPHPALSPVPDPSDASSIAEQDANEQAWRQLLAQSVLAVLLPTEDLQNECLRSLVGQILAEMIVGNIIGTRICESWALWELITNAIEAVRAKGDTNSSKTKKPGSGITDAKRSKKMSDKYQDGSNIAPIKSGIDRLEQYGLMNNSLDRGTSTGEASKTSMATKRTIRSLTNAFWTLLHYGIIIITAGRAIALMLLSPTHLVVRRSSRLSSSSASEKAEKAEGAARSGVPKSVRPIVDMMAWKTVANLVELPSRMPWLSGLASLAHWTAILGPGRLGEADGRVDR